MVVEIENKQNSGVSSEITNLVKLLSSAVGSKEQSDASLRTSLVKFFKNTPKEITKPIEYNLLHLLRKLFQENNTLTKQVKNGFSRQIPSEFVTSFSAYEGKYCNHDTQRQWVEWIDSIFDILTKLSKRDCMDPLHFSEQLPDQFPLNISQSDFLEICEALKEWPEYFINNLRVVREIILLKSTDSIYFFPI